MEVVKEIKTLGLTIDVTLNFKTHIQKVSAEIAMMTSNIDRISGKHWGVAAEMIKIWYYVIIQPKLLYASQVWYDRITVHGVRTLLSAQRNYLAKIIKCYRNTSNHAIFQITGVVPINITAERIQKLYNFKNKGSSVYINGEYLSIKETEQMNRKNLIDSGKPNKSIFLQTKAVGESVHVYSDGSKTPSGVGYGIYIENKNNVIDTFQVPLGWGNTVYQAEMAGILFAAEWLLKSKYKTATVYTDSLSSVESLGNVYPKSPIAVRVKRYVS